MTEIRLHNSATRRKEVFAPLDPQNVRMYVCGPTVYDRAHIGNARPAVVFDVLFRLLLHVYGAEQVTYVRNITDIDDKIMDRAKARGVSIEEITAETTKWYQDDMAALGCLAPTHEPRATKFVPQMIAMIETLIARGFAYEAEGHVLFEVAKYERYGALSGRSTDDMIAGARVEVAPYKRDPMDFVLWKPSADDQPGWDSPWGPNNGRGRPGWHIECSAMAKKLLGETFDIHGGGADLQFPHHENEIAQSCCAMPGAGFAKVWMHNDMVAVDGKKMSKSLGNFITMEDLRGQAPGEVLRLALLSTQYRGTLDWTQQKLDEADSTVKKFFDLIVNAGTGQPDQLFIEALADDLNLPLALKRVHEIATGAKYSDEAKANLRSTLELLGMFEFIPTVSSVGWGERPEEHASVALAIARKWMKLREAGEFGAADELRRSAAEQGVQLRVLKEQGRQTGTANFSGELKNVSALESLL